MADLKAQFEAAAQEVQSLSRRPDNDTLLKLYAFYKQATLGDVSGKRPEAMDMVGRAKYDAWASLKGVSKDKAMMAYIRLVERLKEE
jgi:acyl-CoA-binding protein